MVCEEEVNKDLSNSCAGRKGPRLPPSCEHLSSEISHGGSWSRQEFNAVSEEEEICKAQGRPKQVQKVTRHKKKTWDYKNNKH